MFRSRPSLAADVLHDVFDMAVPAHHHVRLESGDLPDLTPTEYRADVVIGLVADDEPVLAVVVEVQLGRDRGKKWSWPVYLTTLRARLRCPTVLLVVCVDHAIATWCAEPIDIGHPGWVLSPTVLGPTVVPVITDVAQASRAPELAVLSAVAHPDHPERKLVHKALLAALEELDPEHYAHYSDIVLAALPDAARRELEAQMVMTKKYEYQSDFVRKYIFQGRLEGKAEGKAEGKTEGVAMAVLTFLDARDVKVLDVDRDRIIGCKDEKTLATWIRRATTAESIEDILVEDYYPQD